MKNVSTSRFHTSISRSHEFSQGSGMNDRLENKKLQGGNQLRAKTNDKLLRYRQKTSKNYRFPLVPDLANSPLH